MKTARIMLLLALLVFVAGCTGFPGMDAAITEVIKSSPMVQEFLEEYPDAQINVRYLNEDVVANDTDFIGNCSGVPAGDYYKATIEDPTSGINIKAWIDMDSQKVLCIFKESPVTTTTTIKKQCASKGELCGGIAGILCCSGLECEYDGNYPDASGICKEEATRCQAHHETKCYEGHVYWYDSCGNKEEKKEYCENGCEAGACIEAEDEFCGSSTYASCNSDSDCKLDGCSNQLCQGINESLATVCDMRECYNGGKYGLTCGCFNNQCQWKETECTSHHEYKCYSGHVYWYNSCGDKEDKKEYCENGCEARECIEVMCTDTDDGDNYYLKGTVEVGVNSYPDHCNDGSNLTEKYCENNEMNYVVYECRYGCMDGACIEGYICSEEDQLIGDLNNDDAINDRDLNIIIDIWQGNVTIGNENICCGNLNNDETIDMSDVLKMSNYLLYQPNCFVRGYSCSQKENCEDGIDNDCDEQVDLDDDDCI